MGSNSRSYSGINAAVRFGDLDNHRADSVASYRPKKGREVRCPQKCDGNLLLVCQRRLCLKRKGPAGHPKLSHFFPTPLLQPTTMPQCIKPMNPNSRRTRAHAGYHPSPDVPSCGIVRWSPPPVRHPLSIENCTFSDVWLSTTFLKKRKKRPGARFQGAGR